MGEPSSNGSDEYSAAKVRATIKKIAKQAVAAELFDLKWYGRPEEGFNNSGFDQQLPPVTGPTGTIELIQRETAGMGLREPVPPPGARLTGTSHPPTAIIAYHYEVDPWVDIYQPWMQRIEDAFSGFDELPDPKDFEGPISDMQAAVGSLTPLESAGGSEGDKDGDRFASADLASDLATLNRWVSPTTPGAWSGATVYAFDTSYGATRIKAVLKNQAQLAIMLGIGLKGEQKIWEKSRKDTMRLMEDAALAFEPGGGGLGVNLEVVGALVDIASAFIPPAYQVAFEAGSSALGLIEPLLPAKEADKVESTIKGGDADEIYTSMLEAVAKLDGQIVDREEDLAKSLSDLLKEMSSMRASDFHIHPDKGVEPDLESGELKADPRIMGNVGYNVVPRIASTMARGAEEAEKADKELMWQRTRVGVLSSGPYPEWSVLRGELDKVATGSAAELTEAGRLLAVAAGGIKDVDEETERANKGLTNELDRGKDGYSNDDVDYIPPPPGGPSAA
jgi:hypothetical protein